MANLIRQIFTKFYRNLPRSVKDMTKNLVCFRFTVSTAVHLQKANDKFHKVRYLPEVERFTFLYDKCTQNNMYQILSESIGFCRNDDKYISAFFRFTVYIYVVLLL